MSNLQMIHILTEKDTGLGDDIQAIEFSSDINKPGRYQTKDGEWHEGRIPEDEKHDK